MKKLTLFLTTLFCAGVLLAGNTKKTVDQVSTAVEVSADVDYIITSTTPFVSGGSVNITNTEHAVVIIKGIKPSKVISSWLKYVKINGATASNGSNCQVKMYGRGAIIFPYSKDIKPLTVYSEQNFGGTSVNNFGLENSGGFMNTLSEEKLNNQIRSFKLKRGYMVTFSTRKEGRGYSRCFIADQEDLEVSELPVVLDKSISSYRVFHWYNAHKAGLASDTRAEANDAVNASWCYDWGTGVNRLPDVECVPNHIYEDWPSPSSCGSVTYSCHMKTNNEPGNSADDHPQDVATVLANWENLMRTGLRLCSESSHDGSMNHLKAFIDSIDARGWRCDLLDLHCYWPAGTFNNLDWYSNNYGNGRPIWISEWVWGASWNHNGFWAAVSDPNSVSEANQNTLYNGTKPILDVLNSNSKVERYAYWNSEAAGTHIYHDGNLTKLGEYYATMDDGLGYKAANEFIPKNPRQYDPSDLSAKYDKNSGKVSLTWHERNGEYNALMDIQVKRAGTASWKTVQEVALEEDESDYNVAVEGKDGDKFRVRLLDVNNVERFTNEATAVNEDLAYGDGVTIVVDGTAQTMYLGGNQFVNGDFELGFYDWTNGAGEPLSTPYFQVVPAGGVDGGAYLQCYGSSADKMHAQSVRKLINLKSSTCYYLSASGCNNDPDNQILSTTSNEAQELFKKIKMPAVSSWATQGVSFKVASEKYLMVQLRNLAGVAMFDEFMLCELFATQEEALADALAWEKMRAEAVIGINTRYPALNESLQQAMTSATDALQLQSQINEVLDEMHNGERRALAASLVTDEEKNMPFEATAEHYQYNTLVSNPTFASSADWTKCGNYTGGDQRTATHAGMSAWNAWWSLPVSGNEDKTMGIMQTVSHLEHGLYALEVKATTQHLCETDQHAYLSLPETETTIQSLPIHFGKLDLPGLADADRLETLATSYLYVEEGASAEIGFIGSKQGAVDKQWMPSGNPTGKGDNREGWWVATDFRLRFVPMKRYESDSVGWGTLCLPAAFIIPDNVTLYEVTGIYDDKYICINPVTEPRAGCPYIYKANEAHAALSFFEQGETVASPMTNVNGLRGFFAANNALVREGSLLLKGGRWITTGKENRPALQSFSANIYKRDNLPVLSTWEGEMMPIDGAELSIESVAAEDADPSYYNLQGQPVVNPGSGFYICNGKLIKRLF